MLNILQYILYQPTDSLLYKMYQIQKENPTKGDWVSSVTELMETYNINLTLNQIQDMKRSLFKNHVKRQVEKLAFTSLTLKQKGGKKGQKLGYKCLEMADYLLPECEISYQEKIEKFHIRTEMNDLPFNYGN